LVAPRVCPIDSPVSAGPPPPVASAPGIPPRRRLTRQPVIHVGAAFRLHLPRSQAPTTPARLAATDATVAPRSSTVRARPEPVGASERIRMHVRRMLLLVLLACLALGGVRAQAPPLHADCSFTQGFATLHSLIPDVVGDCVANALPQPSGDVQQQTANGM